MRSSAMAEKTNDKNLTSTQEDYLEAILELTEKRVVARNMELSSKLGVRRATVTRALKLLTQKGLVNHEMNGYVQESSPTPLFKSINSSVLSFLHSPTLTSIHDHRKIHSLD